MSLSTYRRLLPRMVGTTLARWFRPHSAYPYRLSISVNNVCNHKCRICLVWKTYLEEPEARSRELRLEEFQKLFSHVGRRLCWLSLTGGEPFLRADLAEIVRAAVASSPHLAMVSINSTGFGTQRIRETVERIMRMPGAFRLVVVVSLDGPPEVHDELRGVPGAYQRAVDTVRALEEMGRGNRRLQVRNETVVSSLNVTHLDGFLKAPPLGHHRHIFALAQESSRYRNVGLGVPVQKGQSAAIHEALDRAYRVLPVRSPETLVFKLFYRLGERFLNGFDRQVLPCFSSFASVVIGAAGDVRPCVMMPAVGHLRDFDFDLGRLLATAEFAAAREEILADRCPNCWTPCEATQTVIHNLPLALLRACLTGRHRPAAARPISPAPIPIPLSVAAAAPR